MNRSPCDLPAVIQPNPLDEAAFAILEHLDDAALDAGDAARLALLTEVTREQGSIEMVGVIDVGERRMEIAPVGKSEAVLVARRRSSASNDRNA